MRVLKRFNIVTASKPKSCTLKTAYREKDIKKYPNKILNQFHRTNSKEEFKTKVAKSCNAIQRTQRLIEESIRDKSEKIAKRSSKKGHKADALALRADERRDKLR